MEGEDVGGGAAAARVVPPPPPPAATVEARRMRPMNVSKGPVDVMSDGDAPPPCCGSARADDAVDAAVGTADANMLMVDGYLYS